MSELHRQQNNLPLMVAQLGKQWTPSALQYKKKKNWKTLSRITVSVTLLLLLDFQLTPISATPIEYVLNTTSNSQYVDAAGNKWMSPVLSHNNNSNSLSRGSARKGYDRHQDNAIEASVPSSLAASVSSGSLSTTNNFSSHENTLVVVPHQTTAPTPPIHMLSGHNSNNNKRERQLKCHCDICKDNNYICETDGYCFTSVVKDDDKIIFSYRFPA